MLLAFAAYRSSQRKTAQAALDSAALMSEFPPDSRAVFGATGGQSVDTGNSSILQTDFSQSGLSSIDADEGVDPVAEADVYMAYGRDAQAEEILEDALKADPNRAAIYLKLLEIFAQRKSPKQFETTASELFSRTGGRGADWEKAVQMGRKLDPDNPLYSAGPIESERTVPPATELPSRLPPIAAAVASAATAAAVVIPESAADNAGEETGPALSSLDFTSSSTEPSLAQAKAVPEDAGAADAGDLPDILLEVDDAADEQGTINVEAIDFDLGGDQDLPAPVSAAAPEPAAQPEEDFNDVTLSDSDLELDFDLGADEFKAEAEQVEAQHAASAENQDDASTATMVEGAPGAAFSHDEPLEFDLPDLGGPATGKAGVFDMGATLVQSQGPVNDGDDAVMDLEKTSFDSSLLDFDFDLETPPAEAAKSADAGGLDLTSFDLDLEPAQAADSTATAAAPSTPAKSVPEVADDEGEIDHEVETKLELARAYDEMGDKEGALELLNEVVAEGSAAQQAAARALIEKLG